MVEVVAPDSWRPPERSVEAALPPAERAAEAPLAEAVRTSASGDPASHGPESARVMAAVPQGPLPSGTERFGHRLAITVAVGGVAAGSLALLALYVFGRQAPVGEPIAAAPTARQQPALASPERPLSAATDPAPVPPARRGPRGAANSNAARGRHGPVRREMSELDAGLKPGPHDAPADEASGRPNRGEARPGPKKDARAHTPRSAAEVLGAATVTTAPAGQSSGPDANGQPEPTGRRPGSRGRPTHRGDNSKPVMIPQPTAESVDVQARLNDPIVQIDFQDVPLLTMTRFLIALTRVPITLDLDSLTAAGVTPTSPVSVHQQETTVRKVLALIVAQRTLVYHQIDDQIVIGGPNRDAIRVVYPVGDLVRSGRSDDSRARVSSLISQVEHLVEPATWQINGGAGQLKEVRQILPDLGGPTSPATGREAGEGRAVRAPPAGVAIEVIQTPVVQQKVARFFARLRVARHLPAGDRRQTALDSRRRQARDKLEERVTFTFAQPTPLLQIAGTLGRLSQLSIVVDWRSLAPLGITPGTRITCSAVDRPFGEALTEQLARYDLAWRAVDRSTLEILSRADAARRFDVGFQRLPTEITTNAARASLLRDLQRAIAPRTWSAAGGQGVALFDVPSGYLVVRQTQPIQHEVRRFLAAWSAASR